MELNVTTFRGLRFTAPKEQTTLKAVLDDIKSDKWKSRIEKCRLDLKHKDWLPVFTPTGTFSHRSIKGMETYNGVICLDIDNVEDPTMLKEKCKQFLWIHAAYITPSGKGLKVIVMTANTSDEYRFVEETVAGMFRVATGFSRDNRCKDIARIQFISWDPDLYYNENPQIVKVAVPIEETVES